jgi:DNA polymerase III subunit beta
MKFVINKNDISDALSRLQGIAGRKSSLAITETVLIRAGLDTVTISATDLETGFEGIYPAVIEKEGMVAVNAKKFGDIVKMFPTEIINISELQNQWIEIASDSVEYHLVGMNPEEFPEIPKIADVEFFKIHSGDFKRMIDRAVNIGYSGDEKREHIIGVLLECMEENNHDIVRMVSTDGRRLSKMDYLSDDAGNKALSLKIIIPKKGLVEVNKFLDPGMDVEIGVQGNHFIIKKENEVIILNLLDGDFPDYRELLDIDNTYDIELPRDLFSMTLKRMSIMTSEEYRGVGFYFENDQLMVRVVNPIIGESKEILPVAYQREPIEAVYNPRYFIEAMAFYNEEKVLLNINDAERPCVLHAGSNQYINIIMPMKI